MTSPGHSLIILCNAIDDRTRTERGIVTDSPAASRKVFLMARALAGAGVNPLVLSMGRGRADGSGRSFAATARRSHGVPAVYMRFTHTRVLSELVSLFSPVYILWRRRRSRGRKTIVFYNQLPAYLVALVVAKVLGYLTVLDLEDSSIDGTTALVRITDAVRRSAFEVFCSRAMLACSALVGKTGLRPTFCYYGVVEKAAAVRDWSESRIHVLLGGTIAPDTGADLLADAIAELRANPPEWARSIVFEVTGKGPSVAQLTELATHSDAPNLIVHGRTTDAEYREIVARAHVGLALKPNEGVLAHTTFPSKVTEMAAAGMLVLSTDISDVRAVLGDGARYLERDDAVLLIERLREIVVNREAASESADIGMRAVAKVCSPQLAGKQLAEFLFPERG